MPRSAARGAGAIASRDHSRGGSFSYTSKKNPTSIQHKLGFMKVCCLVSIDASDTYELTNARWMGEQFDPIVRQHVLFTEVRISRTKK